MAINVKQDISMPKPNQSRKEYQAAYRQNNPDKVKQWRLTEHTKALLKAGYTVIDPDGNVVKEKINDKE